jgi:hypothetical protein
LKSRDIPSVNIADGPQGVGDLLVGVTCWPSGVTAAATWYRRGRGRGEGDGEGEGEGRERED